MKQKWLALGFAVFAGAAMACGEDETTPASPTSPGGSSTAAAADGSTFKITAPTLFAPADNAIAEGLTPNLVIQNASSKYVPSTIPTYQFVVVDSANVTVASSGAVASGVPSATLTAYRVPSGVLKARATYRWRARGTSGSAVGPWSPYFTFKTP